MDYTKNVKEMYALVDKYASGKYKIEEIIFKVSRKTGFSEKRINQYIQQAIRNGHMKVSADNSLRMRGDKIDRSESRDNRKSEIPDI